MGHPADSGSRAASTVPLPRRALDPQAAAERVDAVGDAHQPVALRIRSADAVVAHLEREHAVLDRGGHGRPRRPRVLDDVGERLGAR